MRDDDAGSAANALGLTGFPFLVVVGSDGTVLARGEGEIDAATLVDYLKSVG